MLDPDVLSCHSIVAFLQSYHTTAAFTAWSWAWGPERLFLLPANSQIIRCWGFRMQIYKILTGDSFLLAPIGECRVHNLCWNIRPVKLFEDVTASSGKFRWTWKNLVITKMKTNQLQPQRINPAIIFSRTETYCCLWAWLIPEKEKWPHDINPFFFFMAKTEPPACCQSGGGRSTSSQSICWWVWPLRPEHLSLWSVHIGFGWDLILAHCCHCCSFCEMLQKLALVKSLFPSPSTFFFFL